MARFHCRGEEGRFVYDGRHACPRCGSVDVQFSIEELADDHSLITALAKLAESDLPDTETET
jgi:hypothetical protein